MFSTFTPHSPLSNPQQQFSGKKRPRVDSSPRSDGNAVQALINHIGQSYVSSGEYPSRADVPEEELTASVKKVLTYLKTDQGSTLQNSVSDFMTQMDTNGALCAIKAGVSPDPYIDNLINRILLHTNKNEPLSVTSAQFIQGVKKWIDPAIRLSEEASQSNVANLLRELERQVASRYIKRQTGKA